MDSAQSQLLDLPVTDGAAGFRLSRFEVFNWGTFHNRVWTLELGGGNALLTGDIGSGKSTLVDALTTLLVAPQKLNYNKAAGADDRERSARSYFFGYYKRERGDPGSSAKIVALRDANSYSVILAVFYNQALKQHVTLAQVYWAKDTQGQPARFYVVANAPLSIAAHFSRFGSDINALKKRLRAIPHVEVHESFPPYGSAYRRRFGIEHEQAMDLFNQTVSMKSVGNLTDFVRDHMLQPFDVESRIEALIGHFEDLNRAHQAVVKAKDQIERLSPLVEDCDERDRVSAQATVWRGCRDALRPWFRLQKLSLLTKRIGELAASREKLDARIQREAEVFSALAAGREDLLKDIAAAGGDRIERIKKEMEAKQGEKDRRARRGARYDEFAQAVGLPPASDAEAFLDNHKLIQTEQAGAEARHAARQNDLTEAAVELRGLREKHSELQAELLSLRGRRSNIPRNTLDLRAELCRSTGLPEQELPFAGELIQVRDEERDWEAAVERMLHGFGLSLLVADRDYARVSEWVDRTHLHGRLVYYRVAVRPARQNTAQNAAPNLASVTHKVGIKPESAFYGFLESKLNALFPHICCESMEEFRREPFALTRSGQIKTRGERHEKDDRHAIDDRSRFVLGWSNEAKIAVLETQARDLEIRIQNVAGRISKLQMEMSVLQTRIGNLKQLSVFQSFQDLDWKTVAVEIEQLDQERRDLESRSDALALLQGRLQQLDGSLKETNQKLLDLRDERSRADDRHKQAEHEAAECTAELASTPEDVKTRFFAEIESMSAEALGGRALTIESCHARESEMRDWLQRKIDAEDARIRRLTEKILAAMSAYRNLYPVETQEVDVSVEAAGEYRLMLHALASDDLPQFERRFKELLNENTIREVANFQSQLGRERETIRERVATINRSLHSIDYNPGRFIALEAEQSVDVEIREFQQDLRACTEGSLTGSEEDQYSEAKFLQVRRIIERFRGREGSTEADRRWTRKVTDVRHWFTFSASERWREDNSEFEHHTDSGGKSGGQKEKLAYTVLAASLAYQFGLEWGAARARSFRFAMIDEAFGRGSDESARYGLELFQRLDLQLLIVTPLQKIHVIEPYVTNVGFVHIEGGRLSMLRNLTIEEYRAERAARGA
jgi:uncharacterized protein YPO0396